MPEQQKIVPNPDPSEITSQAIDRRVAYAERTIEARLAAMEKATSLWHDDLVRVPTDVQKAVQSLRDFMEQAISRHIADLNGNIGRESQRLDGAISTLKEVSEERFRSVQTQFTLLKQATEQLDLANKTAIAAALQAQKESAGETQKSSQAAIAKSETSTAEAIKALTTTFNVAISGLTDRYTDLKGRMDRGEGKQTVMDPAVIGRLEQLSNAMNDLRQSRDQHSGKEQQVSDSTARTWSIVAIAVAVIVGLGQIFLRSFPH